MHQTEAQKVADLEAELERVRESMATLLQHAGNDGTCSSCKARIIWLQHIRTGKVVPYDLDGVNHYITCSNAAAFREKRYAK